MRVKSILFIKAKAIEKLVACRSPVGMYLVIRHIMMCCKVVKCELMTMLLLLKGSPAIKVQRFLFLMIVQGNQCIQIRKNKFLLLHAPSKLKFDTQELHSFNPDYCCSQGESYI
ncbi:hypothetical protein FKM82_012220 [Ascaphus truei]